MEDVSSVKARQGHTSGKSFWWIEDVLINGRRSSLQVMFGRDIIGDKACCRLNNGREIWFEPGPPSREAIIQKGKSILRKMLKGKTLRTLGNAPFAWE